MKGANTFLHHCTWQNVEHRIIYETYSSVDLKHKHSRYRFVVLNMWYCLSAASLWTDGIWHNDRTKVKLPVEVRRSLLLSAQVSRNSLISGCMSFTCNTNTLALGRLRV